MTDGDIHPISGPNFRDDDDAKDPQPKVDAYTSFVLEKLVGVKGRTISDVAYFILRDWIQTHHAELEHLGINVRVQDGGLVVRQKKV